jgi:hypothetical protein
MRNLINSHLLNEKFDNKIINVLYELESTLKLDIRDFV